MNVKNTILLLTMASLIACSENIENEQASIPTNNGVADDLVPVEFSVSGMRNVDFTRATSSIVSFDVNEKVKVWVKPAGATDYSGYDYTTATSGQYNVPLTAPTLPPYYPPGASTTVEAYAYYPSTAGETFTVQDDQTLDADYKASDLMYAVNRTVTKDGSNGNDCLTLEHQMAQLVITAQAQTGSGLTISEVEVEAYRSITFDPDPSASDRVSSPNNKGTITALKKTADIGFAAGTGYIVIPPQVINGVIIRIKTGSGTADETATYAFTGTTGSFQSGASYNLNLTVSPDQLGLASSISNWNGLGSVNVTPSGNLTVSPITAQEYTGQALEPAFTVYRDGTFFSPDNYNVQWVNNKESGVAYIIVTGKNMGTGADYSTCVGLTSFKITPAYGKINYGVTSVTKTYGNEPFTNPLSNYDTRDGDVSGGRKADGPVTYTSSKPEVATVNEATGEVTILKAGTATITATASSGANYVYDTTLGNHTSSYELTVNEAAGSISFGFANPIKIWSPTTSENVYTEQILNNTGDSPVTYSVPATDNANNTCDATIDPSSGAVSFTKSGSVVVTATVSDTEHYKYAVKTATYTLTVNKADGNVTLSSDGGSVNAGSNATITVSSSHGGTLSAAATSGATTRVGTITVSGNTVTVPTNGYASANVTITVTCAATDCYNAASATYDLEINNTFDIKMNPLWYVAKYNLNSNLTFNTTASTSQGYIFLWSNIMIKGFTASQTSYDGYDLPATPKRVSNGEQGATWHVPTHCEWESIIPTNGSVSLYNNTYFAAGLNTEPGCTFGFDNSTKYKNGSSNSSNTGVVYKSYWSQYTTDSYVRYAIRFLDTKYCSVWKYEFLDYNTTSCRLVISARLIDQISSTDASTLSSVMSTISSNSYDWSENEALGAVQRTFYACGYTAGKENDCPGTSDNKTGCYYWSATEASSNTNLAWVMGCIKNNNLTFTPSGGKTNARTLRLFRDN